MPADSLPRTPLGRTPAQAGAAGTPDTRVPAVMSEQLFRGASEVHIHHGSVTYRLRQTSLGKLILTK